MLKGFSFSEIISKATLLYASGNEEQALNASVSGFHPEMKHYLEGSDACENQWNPYPASSSPLSSPCCSSIQTWLPMGSCQGLSCSDHRLEPNGDFGAKGNCSFGKQASEHLSSDFFEELFCTVPTSNTLAPLASALRTSCGPQRDVVKQGYLGKLEQKHRRYFVLRAGSHTGPSRLEWYKNQEKFTAMEKSSGETVFFRPHRQGVIYLRCCLGVSRICSSRKDYKVALYAKAQTLVFVGKDEQEQDEWYLAIKNLIEEEVKDEDQAEGFDEEDDGYSTLPPASSYKQVWPVTVKSNGLGRSKSLAGETLLCLTSTSLILVRVGACNDLPSITLPLLNVRRFGHLDGSFFLELGRSAPTGPGEIWMEARDEGNPSLAQQIHEVVRGTVRALRALPDFSRSPSSNHTTNSQSQSFLALKRCRTKHKEKLVHSRPLHFSLAVSQSEIQTIPAVNYNESQEKDNTELESTSQLSPSRSQQSSTTETDTYKEMKMDHRTPVRDPYSWTMKTRNHCRGSACRADVWESGQEEGLGYMEMSPQVSPGSFVLYQDEYVTMASPQKPTHRSSSSSLQTSFNSSTFASCSPLHSSHHLSNKLNQRSLVQQSETGTGQSQMSNGYVCPSQDVAEQKLVEQRRCSTQTTSSLTGVATGSGMTSSFIKSRGGHVSPNSDTDQSICDARPDQSAVGRHLLLSCLLSCLQVNRS